MFVSNVYVISWGHGGVLWCLGCFGGWFIVQMKTTSPAVGSVTTAVFGVGPCDHQCADSKTRLVVAGDGIREPMYHSYRRTLAGPKIIQCYYS